MEKDQKRALIIILVVAVAVVIGIVNWQANKNAQKKEAAKAPATVSRDVTVLKDELPSGWGVEYNETSGVMVRKPANNCYAAARYSTDVAESNAPTMDHNQDRIDAIKSKNYEVEVLPAGSLTLVTKSGEKQVTSQILKISQTDTPTLYQGFGYVSTDKFYANVDTSCLDPADLPEAAQALQALRFDHEL